MRLDPSEIRDLILLVDGNDIYILKNAEAARAWLEPDLHRDAEDIVFSGDGRRGTLRIDTQRPGNFFRGQREVVEFSFPSDPTQESREEFASILNGIFRVLDVRTGPDRNTSKMLSGWLASITACGSDEGGGDRGGPALTLGLVKAEDRVALRSLRGIACVWRHTRGNGEERREMCLALEVNSHTSCNTLARSE